MCGDFCMARLAAFLPEDLERQSRPVDHATFRLVTVWCAEARATSVKPLLNSENDRTDDPRTHPV